MTRSKPEVRTVYQTGRAMATVGASGSIASKKTVADLVLDHLSTVASLCRQGGFDWTYAVAFNWPADDPPEGYDTRVEPRSAWREPRRRKNRDTLSKC